MIRTTVPAQQPQLNRNELAQWVHETQFLGLTVHQHTPRIGKHHAQVVSFTAQLAQHGATHAHHEQSAFVQINGAWYFIDPTVALPSMKSPCICGSGKKFKACCGQFFK
ncbi:YchJ family protein [Kingella sp. (in: b-proteobacteria)]|uniref:YchJ family protein n=1 Tax=Kingella sp. (in: b-proteobacteria) TaxID=2020713 RepID=UPI0034C6DDCE